MNLDIQVLGVMKHISSDLSDMNECIKKNPLFVALGESSALSEGKIQMECGITKAGNLLRGYNLRCLYPAVPYLWLPLSFIQLGQVKAKSDCSLTA